MSAQQQERLVDLSDRLAMELGNLLQLEGAPPALWAVLRLDAEQLLAEYRAYREAETGGVA